MRLVNVGGLSGGADVASVADGFRLTTDDRGEIRMNDNHVFTPKPPRVTIEIYNGLVVVMEKPAGIEVSVEVHGDCGDNHNEMWHSGIQIRKGE